jgi:dihydroflavonol-4-reductase
MADHVLVTGATGFVGRGLVRRLHEQGSRVRILERRQSDAFDDLQLERTRGDVTDPASLAAALEGIDTVVHLAGIVSHLERDRERMMAVNVGGVRSLLAAAREAGVGRVVHVSSVGSVGTAPDEHHPLDEDSPFPEQARRFPYALSKRLGEEAALRAAADGQDVVIVCPAFVIGAGDVNRVSTFPLEQYLRGALRFTTPGGLSYVDVRDVVSGILLALEGGKAGRRYILGTPGGNLSHREFFALVGEVDGKPRRTVHLPGGVLVPASRVLARLRIPLPVAPDELAPSCHYWYSTTGRAIDELGYAPRPVREAVEATVEWYRQRGMRSR